MDELIKFTQVLDNKFNNAVKNSDYITMNEICRIKKDLFNLFEKR